MNSGFKFALGGLCITIAISYLAFVGASTSWQYYLSVDEVVDNSPSLAGKRLRVSGRICAGTLAVANDRRGATFDLHGEQHHLRVSCRCTMPDNIAENLDVVVEGVLEDDGIRGHKLITRCASKYEAEGAESAPSKLQTVNSELEFDEPALSINLLK